MGTEARLLLLSWICFKNISFLFVDTCFHPQYQYVNEGFYHCMSAQTTYLEWVSPEGSPPLDTLVVLHRVLFAFIDTSESEFSFILPFYS